MSEEDNFKLVEVESFRDMQNEFIGILIRMILCSFMQNLVGLISKPVVDKFAV